jgi:hypothetical protein
MKLFNLFKKETTSAKKLSVQKLEKAQLVRVIGGGDGTIVSGTSGDNSADRATTITKS